uniref:Protein TsetseEP domain-containing protein n=1 Tax=Clastoptera arizonana TaxID=38151 RepID=A0A1B6CZI1_9HEMI
MSLYLIFTSCLFIFVGSENNDNKVNLSVLDNDILHQLKDLQNCDVEKLLEDTRFCAAELDDLADLCDHKRDAGIELYGMLGLQGEPRFHHFKVNSVELTEKYNWDQNDVDGLLNNLSRANYAWERYQLCLNRNSTQQD